MRKLLIIGVSLSVLMLSGCLATPNEARSEAPRFEGNSSKTAKELAGCIYNGWTNTRITLGRDNTTHTEYFDDVITVFTVNDVMFADVKSIESGSNVKFYKTTFGAMPAEWNRTEVIEKCLVGNGN
jgi:micrococcal nuclease